jgi:hypothetical protein
MKIYTLLFCAWWLAGCAVEIEEPPGVLYAYPPVDHELVRKGSEKCLDVEGNGSSNGTKVHQWTCHGGAAQAFRLEVVSGDIHRVRHTASGKCVHVAGTSTSNGTQVEIRTCSTSTRQRWRIQPSGSAHSRLQNVASNKCLDVNGASSANGAKVQIWSCNGTDAQKWAIGPIGAEPPDEDPGEKWDDAVVTLYTFQDNSACNSTMTASGRALIPYVSVALPFRYVLPYGQGPFHLGDKIYVEFLDGRTMPNGTQHTGWVQIDDFCGDNGDDSYCFQYGNPNVDLYIGDFAQSGMSCPFSGPGGDGQEDTEVFFGPAPAGQFLTSYGGAAMGEGECGDCDFGKTVQPPACWHYDPGDTNVEYCDCSNSNC